MLVFGPIAARIQMDKQQIRRRPDNTSGSTELDSDALPDGQSGPQNTPEIRRRSSLGPVAWDPAVQPGEIETGLLDAPKPQSSAASHSSIVDDLGNAKYLADNRTSSHTRSSRFSGASTAELVVHSGAGLTDTADRPELREADVSDEGRPTPKDKVEGENWEDLSTEAEKLGESIRAALQVSQREKKNFLPNDALDRIVTKERVRMELSNHDVVPLDKLDSLTDDIWKVTSPSSSKSRGKATTRRRIFAILGLMEKVGEIEYFVQDGLHDNDLPFIVSQGARRGLLRLDRKGRDDKLFPVHLFDKWKTHELESFDTYQWQLTAPYFHLSTETNRKVLHYNLVDNGIILPFIEDDEVRRGSVHAVGGYGDVWRVKIHPAHHNCCEDSAPPHENPSYAVKRLRHNNYEAFNAEVSNLKRFSEKDHVHLIKLLVTFSWREQFYLLFPWADGNLQDFWILYPQPSSPKRDYNLAVWFSEQCLGIAQGLKMIHTADTPSTDDLPDVPGHQIHGRHGDLKPENILWFKPYQDTDQSGFGVLKISDFGLTRFHRTQSKSHFESVAVSPTYRAPEYDIAKMVSQSYDIWTLGCVLLEFVTWYLLGWEEVEMFSRARATDDTRDIREDVFFNFVNIKEDNGQMQTGARAKLSVANEFQTLYKQSTCSDFILDLLTFIEDKLLRVGPKKRANCEEIVRKFAELHIGCLNDQDYCTKRLKVLPDRSGTGLSELSASTLDFSPAMYDRIHRNSLPEHTGPLEIDSLLSRPPDSQSRDTDQSTIITNNSVLPERVQSKLNKRLPERIDTSLDDRLPTPTAFGALPRTQGIATSPSERSNDDTQSSHPQSPTKKVHFEENQKQLPDSRSSEHEYQLGTMRDQPLDQQVQKEEHGEVHQGDVVQSDPGSSSTMELALTPLYISPSTSPSEAQKGHMEPSGNPVEGPTSVLDPEQPDSSIPMNHSAIVEAPTGTTSVDKDGVDGATSHYPESSSLQTRNSLGVDGHDCDNRSEKTQRGSSGDGYPVGTIPATPQPGQAQPQNNIATEELNGKENHSQDEGSGDTAASRSHSRGVKHFFSSMCCFARSR